MLALFSLVRARRDIRDGSDFVWAGSVGTVIEVGGFDIEECEALYTVQFDDLDRIVSARESELEPAR